MDGWTDGRMDEEGVARTREGPHKEGGAVFEQGRVGFCLLQQVG